MINGDTLPPVTNPVAAVPVSQQEFPYKGKRCRSLHQQGVGEAAAVRCSYMIVVCGSSPVDANR